MRGSSQSAGRAKGVLDPAGRGQRGRGQDGDVAGSCPPRGSVGFTLGGRFADVAAAGGAALPRPRAVAVGVAQLLAGPQGAPQHHGAHTGLCCKRAAPSTMAPPCPRDHGLGVHPAPPSCAPPLSPVPALPSAVPWVCSWGTWRVGAVPGQTCSPLEPQRGCSHRGAWTGATVSSGHCWRSVPAGTATHPLLHWGGAVHPPQPGGRRACVGCAHVCTERSHPGGGCTVPAGGRRAGGVPVCGEVQARPQPEKQHLRSPGQSLSSAQRLGHAAAPRRARFRGQRPGLAGGGQRLRERLGARWPPSTRVSPRSDGGLWTRGSATRLFQPSARQPPGSGRDGSCGHHPPVPRGRGAGASPGSAGRQRAQQLRAQHFSAGPQAVSLPQLAPQLAPLGPARGQ